MYKNIIFNPYGTLIDIKENELTGISLSKISMFFSFNGAEYTCEELKDSYIEIMRQNYGEVKKYKYPDLVVLSVLKALYEKKGVHASEELLDQTTKFLHVMSTEHLILRPIVKGLLGTLASRWMKLFALINGQKEFALFEMKYLSVINYFEGVYSSSEMGLSNMDKAVFNHLMTAESLRPGECLFVSDRLPDIKCAKEACVDTAYIKSGLPDESDDNDDEIKATYQILDGDITQLLKYAT